MITGFDQFYRRPLPGEYTQKSAANYETSFEDESVIEGKIANGSITNAKIKSITAEKILSSTLTAVVDIGAGEGGAFLKMDGPNNRFLTNDGMTNRIVIGRVTAV